MLERVPAPDQSAIFDGDTSVAETSRRGEIVGDKTSGDTSVADDESWFAEAAQSLLLPKPGTALHYITGFDERSCQRYAADTVKPPAYFLRRILRSKQGGPFMSALMAGANPPWWQEIEEGRRAIATLARIRKELDGK